MTLEALRHYEESPPLIETKVTELSPFPAFENPPTQRTNPQIPKQEAAISMNSFNLSTQQDVQTIVQEDTLPILPTSHDITHPPSFDLVDGITITKATIVNRPITVLISSGRGDIGKGGDIWLSNEKRTRPTKYRMMRSIKEENSREK